MRDRLCEKGNPNEKLTPLLSVSNGNAGYLFTMQSRRSVMNRLEKIRTIYTEFHEVKSLAVNGARTFLSAKGKTKQCGQEFP